MLLVKRQCFSFLIAALPTATLLAATCAEKTSVKVVSKCCFQNPALLAVENTAPKNVAKIEVFLGPGFTRGPPPSQKWIRMVGTPVSVCHRGGSKKCLSHKFMLSL